MFCAVYPDGRVCISILHKPGGTAELPDDTPASECWRPILNIEAIVVSVLSMLSDPNFSSPANLDASVRPTAEPSALVLAHAAAESSACERILTVASRAG